MIEARAHTYDNLYSIVNSILFIKKKKAKGWTIWHAFKVRATSTNCECLDYIFVRLRFEYKINLTIMFV